MWQFSNGRGVRKTRRQRSLQVIESCESRLLLAATLVKDINTQPSIDANRISAGVDVNGVLYFTAADNTHGEELWRTDGTQAGTWMVHDVAPGSGHAEIQNLTNVNGTLFFTAGRRSDLSLWKSDGTSAGTIMLADLNPTDYDGEATYLTAVGGDLFFAAAPYYGPFSLWKSDGTVEGTKVVNAAPSSGDRFLYALTNVGGTLFFTANDGTAGYELWKSDGTTTGTKMVRDVNAGSNSSDPRSLTNHNGVLYFSADDAANGRELWKSDGTEAGTVRVTDIGAGSVSGNVEDVVSVGSQVFFEARPGASPFPELWVTDGTSGGTLQMRTFDGTGSRFDMDNLVNANGTLMFSARTSLEGRELWKSNGTIAGTQLVKDIVTGSGSSAPYDLMWAGGLLYFVASDAAGGRELWRSDGTTAGTTPLTGAPLGTPSNFVGELAALGSKLFFYAYTPQNDAVMWSTDGTVGGTAVFLDSMPGTGHGYPGIGTGAVEISGQLFFVVQGGTRQGGILERELWKSDGTAAGTLQVIAADGTFNSLRFLTNFNGTLFFHATGLAGGDGLWKSDGTAAGTSLVKQLDWIDSSGFDAPDYMQVVNDKLMFWGDDGVHGLELWTSDGTEAGTRMVLDINPGPAGTSVFGAENLNGILYFSAAHPVTGPELWRSDGTEAGTYVVRDIDPIDSNQQGSFTRVGNTLFFTASTTSAGRELWKTDGTEVGTVLVKDLIPGANSSYPYHLTNVSGTLFFLAADGTGAFDLWKSDGTDAGTVRLQSFNTYGGPLSNVNGTLFFAASKNNTGDELWKSDGTVAGTVLVKDIRPGAQASNPQSFVVADGRLFFEANDGVHGLELWVSDGTESGTYLVEDLAPGTGDPSIFAMHVVGDNLLFAATDEARGSELWRMSVNASPTGLQLSTTSLAENLPVGTVIGDFTTTDANVSDSFTYELVAGTGDDDNPRFSIVGTQLFTTEVFNYEVVSSYTIRVRTTDRGGESFERSFTISVTDANDAPTSVQLLNQVTSLLDDTSTATRIRLADIVVTDDLLGVNGIALTGPDALLFEVHQASLWLKAGTRLNAAVQQRLSVTVSVDDSAVGGSPDQSTPFELTLTVSKPKLSGPSPVTMLPRPEITWVPVPGAVRYEIWINNDSTQTARVHLATSTVPRYVPNETLGIGNYSVWVRAIDGSNAATAWSARYRFRINSPIAFRQGVSQQNSSQPFIHWNDMPGAITYDLWIDNLSTGASQVIRERSLTGSFWRSNTILPIGDYRAWIRGVDASGIAASWSRSEDFRVMPAPTALSPSGPVLNQQPLFTWNSVPGAVRYELTIRDRNTGTIAVNEPGLTTNSWSPPSSMVSGPYRWWVTAVSAQGIQTFASVPADIWIGGRPNLLGPNGSSTDTTPLFRWSVVSDASRYELFVSRVGTQASVVINRTDLTEASFSPLTPMPAGQYRYWVRAIAGSGANVLISPWSMMGEFQIVDSGELGDSLLDTPHFAVQLNLNDALNGIRSQQEVVTESKQVVPDDSTSQEPSFLPITESGHDSKDVLPLNPNALPVVAQIDDVMIQIARTGLDVRRRNS